MVVSHRTILLPTDFSPCSVRAMEWACEHVIREGDKVILLNAVQNVPLAIDPDVVDAGVAFLATDTDATKMAFESAKSDGRHWADHLKRRVGDQVTVESEVAFGGAGSVILDAVEKRHPSMVIVGTHGRTGLSSLLMGSVSSYVNKNCKSCPVILVRSEDDDSK
eukprot:jgi/Hompol1/690/HPOL_000811-RA